MTDVEEKVSTYLSIICIEDKKKDKTYKFRYNDILNYNIFSSTILVIKHFSPLYIQLFIASPQNLVPNLICSNLVSFVDVSRRFEVKTAFVLCQW